MSCFRYGCRNDWGTKCNEIIFLNHWKASGFWATLGKFENLHDISLDVARSSKYQGFSVHQFLSVFAEQQSTPDLVEMQMNLLCLLNLAQQSGWTCWSVLLTYLFTDNSLSQKEAPSVIWVKSSWLPDLVASARFGASWCCYMDSSAFIIHTKSNTSAVCLICFSQWLQLFDQTVSNIHRRIINCLIERNKSCLVFE